MPPLIIAAQKGHTGIVEDLISAGANTRITDREKFMSATEHAASKGYSETVKLLELADKNNLSSEEKIERIKWHKEQIRKLMEKPHISERRQLAQKLTSMRKEFGYKAREYARNSRIVQELRKQVYSR